MRLQILYTRDSGGEDIWEISTFNEDVNAHKDRTYTARTSREDDPPTLEWGRYLTTYQGRAATEEQIHRLFRAIFIYRVVIRKPS